VVKTPPTPLLGRRRSLLLAVLALVAGTLVGILVVPRVAPATPATPPPPPIAESYRPTPRHPSLPAAAAAGTDDELAGIPAAAILPAEPRPPRFVERPAEEWQGMRVIDDVRPMCKETAGCGGGLTCLPDGTCGACVRDDQCLGDEVCALDHCLKRANATCRRKADCDQSSGRSLCVLSGYSEDPRHNADMRSECSADNGPPRTLKARPVFVSDRPPAPPPDVDSQQLLDSLREAE
jgi:hypothetical protein